MKKSKPQSTNTVAPMGYRPSPSEQIQQLRAQLERAEQRTDIEQTALYVAGRIENINALRCNIKSLKLELASNETRLNESLIEHATAVARFKELGAIPQPTA